MLKLIKSAQDDINAIRLKAQAEMDTVVGLWITIGENHGKYSCLGGEVELDLFR